MYKYELHLHTAENDKVAQVGGAELVRLYRDAGYAGMVVTDHSFALFHEWFADELRGADHRRMVERWLRGYYAARNEGEKCGFTVLPGAEVRFADSINDYLVYGLDEEFFYRAPILHRLRGLDELLAVLPEDACVVHAHPFRDGMTVRNPAPLWGIEVHNAGTDDFRNGMARTFAEHYGKAMTSGSDFHRKDALARGGIMTETPITTPRELITTLRSGMYTLIEN